MSYDGSMKRLAAWAALAAFPLLAACSGTIPARNGEPDENLSAILIGSRLIGPTGETRSGRLWINLEEDGGRGGVYALPLPPGQPLLYEVEPGLYRLAPTRNILGWRQDQLAVTIQGRIYHLPFPRELLRHEDIRIKPRKVVPIGVLVAKLEPVLPGQAPRIRVTLDEDVETRRQLVQRFIRAMMDPNASSDLRSTALAWTQALDQSLVDVLSEPERPKLYQPAP